MSLDKQTVKDLVQLFQRLTNSKRNRQTNEKKKCPRGPHCSVKGLVQLFQRLTNEKKRGLRWPYIHVEVNDSEINMRNMKCVFLLNKKL